MKEEEFVQRMEIVEKELEGVVSPAGARNYRLDHLKRTFRNCRKILELEEIDTRKVDREALLTAAMFHDIGCIHHINSQGKLDKTLKKECEKSHEQLSAEYVMKNVDMEQEKLEKTAAIIGGHHRKDPEHYETMILQDADNLDELGALAVWRSLTYAGNQESDLDSEIEYWKENREKLEKMVSRFNLRKTREIAEKRLKRVKDFMESLEKEKKAEDIR